MFRIVAIAFMTAWLGTAQANTLAPDALVKNTTNEVVRVVKQDKDIKGGDKQKVYDLVDSKVLPHFDFKAMTQLAVGKNWRQASPEQQAALIKEFRALLVRTYSAAITGVSDYKIEVKPLRDQPTATDVLVNTEVSKPGAPAITIDYRLELQGQAWKVYDVLVDGVSLVTVYRNQFNSEVRKGGIEALQQSLARRNQRPDATGSN